jgi:hypothetical protein
MDYGNGNQSFSQRNARSVNLGEQLFESWCKTNQYSLHRLGYDEKTGPIDGWFKMSLIIRQMPDYLVKKDNRLAVVSVKGTLKFKTEDYDNLTWFEDMYATQQCPLRFVIARTNGITWLSTDELRQAYEASTNHGVWPDGKAWRELKL